MNLESDAYRSIAESEREELLTVKQYAALFGVHQQTVYSAIRHGHRVEGRIVRPTKRSIRIAVPRESIQTLRSA